MAITSAVTSGGGFGGAVLSEALMTVYSPDIIFKANPVTRFLQVASVRQELGVQPGRVIQFLRYNDLSASASLTELTDMTPVALDADPVQITVSEYGKAVDVSELLYRTAFTNVIDDATTLLGKHYGKTVDGLLRDAALSASAVLYAGNKARATLTANDVLSTDLVIQASTTLQIAKAPKIDLGGGDMAYVAFIHPHQAEDIKLSDSRWQNITNYAGPRNFLRGEIGRIDDVVFVVTTQIPYVDTSGNVYTDGADSGDNETSYNTSVNVYRAVVLGANAIGFAEALPAELRDGGVFDLGRKHRIGWYSIMGAGTLVDEYAVVLETA